LPCDLPQNGIFAEKFTKNGCLGRKNFYRWQLEFYTKLYSMVCQPSLKEKWTSHGKDILPMERDRLVNSLVHLVTCPP